MQGVKIGDPNIGIIALVALYMKLNAIQTFKQNNFDITPEQFYILILLYENGSLYQRQLSQRLLKDRANITRMVNILERRGFVYRQTDEANRRIHKVYLTDVGEEKVDLIFPKLKQLEGYIYKNVSEKERNVLTNILSKILTNLESKVTIQI